MSTRPRLDSLSKYDDFWDHDSTAQGGASPLPPHGGVEAKHTHRIASPDLVMHPDMLPDGMVGHKKLLGHGGEGVEERPLKSGENLTPSLLAQHALYDMSPLVKPIGAVSSSAGMRCTV